MEQFCFKKIPIYQVCAVSFGPEMWKLGMEKSWKSPWILSEIICGHPAIILIMKVYYIDWVAMIKWKYYQIIIDVNLCDALWEEGLSNNNKSTEFGL